MTIITIIITLLSRHTNIDLLLLLVLLYSLTMMFDEMTSSVHKNRDIKSTMYQARLSA